MPKKKIDPQILYRFFPFFVLFPFFLLFLACSDTDKVSKEVSKIELDLEVFRFDQEFAKAIPSDLPKLRGNYPYLFPKQYADSIWRSKLRDTLQRELLEEVGAAFPAFKGEQQDLELFFKYVRYYFPDFHVPKVVTLTSDVDYSRPVILTDSLLLIGLDNYLGSDHKFYEGLPRYIAFGLDQEYLMSDVAGAFAQRMVPTGQGRTFLEKAIYYGKRLYLKDRLIPFVPESARIKYSDEQLNWAMANEEPIWRYFVEGEILYSTDAKLAPRFLDIAPFSKFGLELDNDSPGRIGRYLGWQIVRRFMEKNEVSLQQMLNLSAEELFQRSGYKPKRQ